MLGRQRAPKYHSGDNMRPYLRVKNVFEDRIDVTDVMEMQFSPQEFERYKLELGDILLNEGQSPELVGRPAMYRGEVPGACFTNSLIRFRAGNAVDPRFALYLFRHYLHAGRFQREARITTNIAHLSAGRFSSIEVALPPLAEQRRIVAAIEEHLSRLDAAVAQIETAEGRLRKLRSLIVDAATAGPWEERPFSEVIQSLRNGVFVSRPKVQPPGIPIFRISAVRPMALDVDDIRYAPTSATFTPESFVKAGDLLFTRYSGNPAYVGACAAVPPLSRKTLHPDKLIRVTVDPKRCLSEYIEIAFASNLVRREVEARLKTTAGQVGIAGGQLRTVPVPLPPLEVQEHIVATVRRGVSGADGLSSALQRARLRARSLRHSILVQAFRGELVGQDPDDEPASVLLERIASERAATPRPRREPRAIGAR
jgi:type I restriction enzyme S subunit